MPGISQPLSLIMKLRAFVLVALGLVLFPLIAACDSTSATPTAVLPPSPSGAIGVPKAEWEQKHALILTIAGGDYIYEGFSAPLYGYRVNYWQSVAGDNP